MHINGITESRVNAIWDTVCYLGAGGETFHTRDVIKSLMRHDRFQKKTAECYFNRFVHFARDNPDEFSGPKSKLVRVEFGQYRLDDNPER